MILNDPKLREAEEGVSEKEEEEDNSKDVYIYMEDDIGYVEYLNNDHTKH
jgi:hypothetical protein